MLNLENTSCQYGVVFCDWLDITFSSETETIENFANQFLEYGFQVDHIEPEKICSLVCGVLRAGMGVSKGVVRLTISRGILRVSLSGVALEFIRHFGHNDSMVDFFISRPHHITRLDAAVDFDVVGYKRINYLRDKFPEHCSLSSRALKTKRIVSRGLEGRETGTFYVGHRSKAGVTARCYDKRHQIWETSSVDIGFNVFRYEIVAKFKRDRDGASLSDYLNPARLFYHYASPSLLRKPKSVGDWEPSSFFTFTPEKVDSLLPAQKIKRLLYDSYLLKRIAELSQEDHTGGVSYAMSLIQSELDRRLNDL